MKDGTINELYKMIILDALEVKIESESDDLKIVRVDLQWNVINYDN